MLDMKWHVVLVRPEKATNLGSICRLIQNFGAQGLTLVNSQVDGTDLDLYMSARWATDVFFSARHVDSLAEALFPMSYSVGTTARISIVRDSIRTAILPEQLPWGDVGDRPALVFGSEGSGLTNDDLKLVNIVITLPTSEKYPVLNLSHAVAIVLYEFFRREIAIGNISRESWRAPEPASPELVERMILAYSEYVEYFVEPAKREASIDRFIKLVRRALPTEEETLRLIGVFKSWQDKIESELEKKSRKGKNKLSP